MTDLHAYVRSIRLERDKVPSFDAYPFAIPSIRSLDELALNPRVTFFVGDNGSGKSTLVEAIAILAGYNAEGGSRLTKSISKKIKLSDFLTFNQQLSALLRAGIPILQSIQILGKRMKNEQLRAMLLDVEERIKTGESLSSNTTSGSPAPSPLVVVRVAGEVASVSVNDSW